jgi:hypothetical protein
MDRDDELFACLAEAIRNFAESNPDQFVEWAKAASDPAVRDVAMEIAGREARQAMWESGAREEARQEEAYKNSPAGKQAARDAIAHKI